jgi:hypothetical protein
VVETAGYESDGGSATPLGRRAGDGTDSTLP